MAPRKSPPTTGSAAADGAESQSGHLQTLDRGLRILELLARQESTPTDLARSLAVDRTTVHRVLRTLIARGFVERVDSNGHYRANLRQLLTLIGRLATVGEQNWIALAQIHLNNLSASLGRSANLCMPTDSEMVYLLQVLPGEGITVNSPPGTRRALHCSAVGKAYLAALPERECMDLLAKLRYKRFTAATKTSRAVLLVELKESRSRGFCVDDGEWDALINCAAAPILDRSGRPIASIGVSGLRAAGPVTSDVGARVAGAARLISQALGYHEGSGAISAPR